MAYITPAATKAASLSEAEFRTISTQCAPSVSADMLEAVAKTESGLDPLALHDNTTNASEKLPDLQSALDAANAWIARGDSVDIGIMQINSKNLPSLNITVRDALDVCASIAAGATILQAAYGGGGTTAEQQAALLMALSRYNTGTPFRGILNGYAHRVMENEPNAATKMTASVEPSVTPQPADPNAPPNWDVFADADYAENHGAPWLIYLKPAKPMVVPAKASLRNIQILSKDSDSSAVAKISTTQETMRQQ